MLLAGKAMRELETARFGTDRERANGSLASLRTGLAVGALGAGAGGIAVQPALVHAALCDSHHERACVWCE